MSETSWGVLDASARGAISHPALVDVFRTGDEMLQNALMSVRKHLGVDGAYIAELLDGEPVLREVDAPGLEEAITPGDPGAFAAHIDVPILDADGEALGMFCCLSMTPDLSLGERELQVMRVFADLAAIHVRRRVEGERELGTRRSRIRSVIDEGAFSMVYQPIWDLGARRVMGFEALCRFTGDVDSPPDRLFREAAQIGCEIELETTVIRGALKALGVLGEDCYLAVNASARTVVSGALAELKSAAPLHRLVLEITEHDAVEDYSALDEALAPLRSEGLRVAVDDAGAGYASLRHIVLLKPDIVKLDMSLTRDVDADPSRQALASAMSMFCSRVHILLVAEGIETWAELDTLRALGVPTGQGFHLGRPTALEAANRLARRTDAALAHP